MGFQASLKNYVCQEWHGGNRQRDLKSLWTITLILAISQCRWMKMFKERSYLMSWRYVDSRPLHCSGKGWLEISPQTNHHQNIPHLWKFRTVDISCASEKKAEIQWLMRILYSLIFHLLCGAQSTIQGLMNIFPMNKWSWVLLTWIMI